MMATVLQTDGTTSTLHPDGTRDVRAPDGRCRRLAPDGTVLHTWREPPPPQWQPSQPTAARQPDGSIVVYLPDGGKELWIDGRVAARFAPDGWPLPTG